jgi:hypothetical protein
MSRIAGLPAKLVQVLLEIKHREAAKFEACYALQSLVETSHDDIDVPARENTDLVEFGEGTEMYARKSLDEIRALLGIPDMTVIPGFNAEEDEDGAFTPHEAEAWAGVFRKRPLELMWHQLVGVLRMLELIFDSLNALNVDEFGLGKTGQALAVIALLRYYRAYGKKHGDFPGAFSTLISKSVTCAFTKPLTQRASCFPVRIFPASFPICR